MFDDEEAVFSKLKEQDEQAAGESIDKEVADNAAAGGLGGYGGRIHGRK